MCTSKIVGLFNCKCNVGWNNSCHWIWFPLYTKGRSHMFCRESW